MKLSDPAGRVERLGFYKDGPGFTIVPTAVFRFQKELGLDRNGLAVLLSVMSHARPGAPDYCEAAYSVVVADTGLHRTVVCAWLRILLAPFGSDVVVRRRKKTPDGKTSTSNTTVTGVGLLELAARPGQARRRRHLRYVWRDGAPKRDTNVYFLGPLADRLQPLLRPTDDGANERGSRFGKPRYDIEFEPERSADGEVMDAEGGEVEKAASRFGNPRYDDLAERGCAGMDESEWPAEEGNMDASVTERITVAVRPDGRIAVTFNK